MLCSYLGGYVIVGSPIIISICYPLSVFTYVTYTWVTVLRALSVGSLIFVLGTILTEPYITTQMNIAVAAFASIWMLTMPWAIFHSIANCRPNLRLFLARKRARATPLIVKALAKEMGVSVPHRTKLVAMDKVNAATNGTTTFITSAFEPYLYTRIGEAVLAHELAHIKRQHNSKTLLLLLALFFISYVFAAQFAAFPNLIGIIMGVLAFLTLVVFVLPLVSRSMEYEADALASKVVGPAAMISALETLVPNERLVLESDTHPSASARIQRIRAG